MADLLYYPMTFKRLINSMLIIALITCIYFLLLAPKYHDDLFSGDQIAIFDPRNLSLGNAGDAYLGTDNNEADRNSDGSNLSTGNSVIDVSSSNHLKQLEIFGRVVDEQNRPIEDVLVSEERFFYNTRTDSEGSYKIFVGLLKYKYPVLHFLRSGFQGKRINLKSRILKGKSVLEVNVKLDEDKDSIPASGWVGNDIGVGLGGLIIRFTSKDSQGMDKIHHTVISDENGNFSFEGLKSGDTYSLTVFPTADYQFYVDEKFVVTATTPQINIILESLKFVDIEGMIVNSDGLPIPNFEFYMKNVSTNNHFEKLTSDSSGFFSLRKFPVGRISLTTRGPDYFDITGLTLSNNEYKNLNLVVDKGNHYLSGWVSDNNGMPVAKAFVTLDSKNRDGSIVYSSHRVKSTDSSGNFYFDELGSGLHLISVNTYGYEKKEISHRFESQADKVNITLVPDESLFQ